MPPTNNSVVIMVYFEIFQFYLMNETTACGWERLYSLVLLGVRFDANILIFIAFETESIAHLTSMYN